MLETQDLRDFSILTWYERFKQISLKTLIIEIPSEVWAKLLNIESDTDAAKLLSENLLMNIKNAFNELNNSVFAKNSWHAPQDARMFSLGNTLKAQNINDVLLYFTSSPTIQEDFSNAKGIPVCLAMKKWHNIHPAAEFRCIVIHKVLRGITPRDWPTFYSHYKREGAQIIETLTHFFLENVKDRFLKQNYTFDVVLSYPDEPYILDFGPLNSKTNLYAFSWKEIKVIIGKDVNEEIAPVFRYLEEDIGIMSRASALQKIAASQV